MTKLSQQTQLVPHSISCYSTHTDPFTLSDPGARPLSGVTFLLEARPWALGAQMSLTALRKHCSQFPMEGSSSRMKTSRTVGI